MEKPRLYVFLGIVGSGRRAVVADLIENGLDDEARPFLLTSAGEAGAPPDVQDRLAAIERLATGTWSIEESGAIDAAFAAGTTDLFFLTDGRGNPVDQIETLHSWLPDSGAQLARILTVVHCEFASNNPGAMRWYEACFHFSDVVLLGRRDGVPNKWISEFTATLGRQHFPCLVEPVKKRGLANPAVLLEPEARRISMLFDEADAWAEFETDGADDGGDLIGKVDPYLERFVSGQRARQVPDITRFLAEGGDQS